MGWWTEIHEKQSKLANHEAPFYSVAEVTEKIDKLLKMYTKLSNTKKPKAKKEEKAGLPKIKLNLKEYKTEEALNNLKQTYISEKMKAVEEERYEDAAVTKEKIRL